MEELSTENMTCSFLLPRPQITLQCLPEKGKISTRERDRLFLNLQRPRKIVAAVRKKFPEIFIASFKAEYGLDQKDLVEKARQSLEKSGSDLVVANDVSRTDIGFGAEENEGTDRPEGGRTQVLGARNPKKKSRARSWDSSRRENL